VGLHLALGDKLVVRNYHGNPNAGSGPIPVTIQHGLTMGDGGLLKICLDADPWDSTIVFHASIPVTLGGTLELMFAANVDPASQVGRTFVVFDWTGVTPAGAFTVSSPYAWNLSNLYTTGEVTLTGVPEPATSVLAACGLATVVLPWVRRGSLR
jgi:hypothetical protein